MQRKPIIEVKDITVKYGQLTILKDINFDVSSGEIVSIVGGSGCGKTTLMRQMSGLETPTKGNVIIEGEDLTNAYGKDRLRLIKKFGILFQSGGLFASMDIGDNLALSLETYTDLHPRRIDDLIDIYLDAVGLRGYENFLPSELSGGMRKRAAIARALVLNPKILFFDEPSSGLDPLTSAALDKLIIEINSSLKTTMIVVTHDLASILHISNKIIMLDKKTQGIIAEGTPQQMKNYKGNSYVYNFFNRIA